MLINEKLKSFLPTVKPAEAKAFLTEVLGLQLLHEDDYGMEFDAAGSLLRLTTVQEFKPHPFTVLGWNVADIAASAKELALKGVIFEKYTFLQHDELGIWTAADGNKSGLV